MAVVSEDVDNICSSEEVDFIVVVEDFRFGCNRERLSEHSGYFQAMFSCQMKESLSGSVILKGVLSVDDIRTLLTSVYSSINIDNDNVFALAGVASIYQFQNVLQSCCQFLTKNITNSNCFSIINFAKMVYLEDIFNIATLHALWNFQHVVTNDEFVSLTHDKILDYLSNLFLNCPQEMMVIDSVERWLEHHKEDLFDVGEILEKSFYADDVSIEDLELLSGRDWVRQNNRIHNMILSALKKKSQTVEPNQIARHRLLPQAILHFDGHRLDEDPPNVKSSMFYLVPENSVTEPIQQTDSTPSTEASPVIGAAGFQATVVGRKIFVTGGEWKLGRNSWQMIVWVYDCLSHKWCEGPKLTRPRRHHGSCAYADDLYLVGGFGAFRTILDSFQQLNVQTGQWTEHPPMLQPEFAPSAAVCDGAVYVFKTCIQRFSLDTCSWSYITVSHPIRWNITYAHVQDHLIYLCSNFNPSLKVFNPKIDEISELYTFQSECHNCVVYHRKLYYFLESNNGSTVECYNLDTREKKVYGEIENGFLGGKILIVPKYPRFRLCDV